MIMVSKYSLTQFGEAMRITVFGATGGTGRQFVAQALAAGHEVTAVIREGSSAEGLGAADAVTANVMDPGAITPLIQGRDAVVSAIGPRTGGFTTVCHDSTRAIGEAMAATGVVRLSVMSSALVTTEGDGPLTRMVVKPMVRSMLRHGVADSIRMEEYLRTTELDWIVMRPPRLTDGERTGRYRTARNANVRGGISVSRADVAAAILAALADTATSRAAVGVAN